MDEDDEDTEGFEATTGVGNMWWMICTLVRALPTANMYQGVVGLIDHLSKAEPGEAFFPSEVADILIQIAATGKYEDPFEDEDGDAEPLPEGYLQEFLNHLDGLPTSDKDHPGESGTDE